MYFAALTTLCISFVHEVVPPQNKRRFKPPQKPLNSMIWFEFPLYWCAVYETCGRDFVHAFWARFLVPPYWIPKWKRVESIEKKNTVQKPYTPSLTLCETAWWQWQRGLEVRSKQVKADSPGWWLVGSSRQPQREPPVVTVKMTTKLSFRARALDAVKPMPIYIQEDVPDLKDLATINRTVPEMPTGMEKEEETVNR